jgi:hypothetical protein
MIQYTRNFEIISSDEYQKKLQVISPIIYISEPETDKKEAVIKLEQ